MKKYLQITIVSILFASVILFKQVTSEEESILTGAGTPAPAQPGSDTSSSPSDHTYVDGSYEGTVEDAYYGNLQVQAIITNGRISNVVLLQYPNDNPTSHSVNTQALVIWRAETLEAQSADIDIVSGASESSAAFKKSLAQALSKAV